MWIVWVITHIIVFIGGFVVYRVLFVGHNIKHMKSELEGLLKGARGDLAVELKKLVNKM